MSDLTLQALLEQEQQHQFQQFDFNDAWTLGSYLQQQAQLKSLPIAIEIWAFGQPLFMAALPGSVADNIEWMKRKRNSVLRFGRSSLSLSLANEAAGQPMDRMPFIRQEEYCDHGGSFPLRFTTGCVFGAVTVSGLPSAEDHAFALTGIQHLLNQR